VSFDEAAGGAEVVTPTGRGARWWAPRLLGVCAIAVCARLAIWREVFVGGAVLPRYPDTYYHLRQILRGVETFPRVPTRDPLLNWPEGGFSVWPPCFDWMGAVLAVALGAGDDPAQAARVAAILPILLGLVTLGVVIWLARRLAPPGPSGDAVALCAGLIWAVLPDAVAISRLGRIDHHIAEALAMALIGAWVLWAARDRDAPGVPTRRALGFEAVGALIALWAGLVFNGSALYVAIGAALLIALSLAAPGRSGGRLLGSGALALAAAALALAAFTAPIVAVHGQTFDFRYPTYLQPTLYAVAALGCLLAALLSRWIAPDAPTGARLVRRAVAAGGGLILAVSLVALLVPALGREVLRGLSEFVARRDPWLAEVVEFKPIVSSWALWRWSSWEAVYRIHGIFGLLALPALAFGCALAVRRHRASGLCFVGWTLALLVLTLLQRRFGRLLTVNVAISWALSLVWLAELVAARAPRLRPGWIWAGFFGLCILSDPLTSERLRWLPARNPSALEAASFYLRDLPGPRDADTGVLAPWDWGNTLVSISGWPILSGGFGPYVGPEAFREGSAALAGGEAELLDLMERRRFGWLATGRSAFEGGLRDGRDGPAPFPQVGDDRVLDIDYFRSRPLAALMLGGGGAPAHGIPHVSHLLPRFASSDRYENLPIPVFRLWLFERVRGARIEGETIPGARVVARTVLRSHAIAFPWEAWADADRAGRYRITVPLPSGMEAPPLATAPVYEVWVSGARVASLSVGERDVREGRTLRVPAAAPDRSVLSPRDGDD
jgi:hypothetical protein